MDTPRQGWMDADLALFQDSTRRLFEKEFAPDEEKWRKQQHADREVWNKAGRMGLLCVSMPEAYGGGGGSFAHEAVVAAEQARAMVYGFSNNVHSAILAHYILNYGTEAQKRRWLPKMATGELVGAIAMSEPGAGSDLKSVRTTAVKEGGEYVVSGSKTFITNGLHADLICVVAKTDAQAGAKGVSLIMVETRDLPGFRRGRLLEKLGQKSLDTAELFFDGVRVPEDNLLGGVEGRGFTQLMQQLPRERLLIAVGAVATMRRAIDETVAYARTRQVFGQALIDLQNTRFKLAECETVATIAARFVDDCIQRQLDGALDLSTAAMAKWWATQMNCQVIDECLQLHGGYGYMLEYPIARMYADARVGRIYGGSNEIMKEIIARGMTA
ncbi:Acyl-CoA dehydrogenase, short-chain specific [Achromobacter denitrificans]|uniref:acyl-CoA dehydrogenase family protein n=1 Tax=Achromobacter denitrificans TaxID=32002 RepID=UPI0009E85170|nr:acyl-CoA dehydrogenase family protein [Achromobacter denitrificans]QKH42632.1 acyl-CoA dehydrogenase family protein [Achromobacter denitrificans]QKH50225.1 acyl-CoA dehydrogenase family protein [Achromobacter denitrificans]CAB3677490.1 Acyl-CoA dehydrogenase [Achromobacter denitrificans]SUU19316.1 Acyl-CoA dehydrogenase, short-chain specific [Achromobacter denitrificans]